MNTNFNEPVNTMQSVKSNQTCGEEQSFTKSCACVLHDSASVIQRAWKKYSFVVLKCDECGKRKNELKDASLIKGIGCGTYLCTNCIDFRCDCCKCMRAYPCECGRAECDVVGGTCEWMCNQYDKYNSIQPPTPEQSFEESMESLGRVLLMSYKRRNEMALAYTNRVIWSNASVTIQRAWRKYSLQKPVEPPLVKVSKVVASYSVCSYFTIKGDLDNAHNWWIKWEVLYVEWKEGDEVVKYEPTQPIDSGDLKYCNGDTEVEVEEMTVEEADAECTEP